MPTEDDFLAAIDADLDNDAPRLAHADWLTSRDPERAEYIRLSIRLARIGWYAWPDAEMCRASELLNAHRERWLGSRPQGHAIIWDFERGYPESVAFFTRAAHDSAWRQALVPPLRWAVFKSARDPRWIIESRALPRVRWLRIKRCGFQDDRLRSLLDAPGLGTLHGLALQSCHFTGAALRMLASLPKLAGLRELDLGGSGHQPITAGDIAALVASPHLGQLRRLDLWGWRLGDEAVRELWKARWPQLTTLRLRQNQMTAEALRGLRTGSELPALTKLDLSNNRVGEDGAVALARATAWTRLRQLNLEGNLIGERGVRALASASHLGELEFLELTSNAIPDGGAEALAGMKSLGSLTLQNNLIGDAGAQALGRSTALARLTRFSLRENPARPEVIAAVVKRFEGRLPPLAEEKPPAVVAAAPVEGGATIGQADEDALVRALFAAPYDDLTRAAYADWLEECDCPLHAQLLRLPPGDPQRRELLEAIRPAIEEIFDGDHSIVCEDEGLIRVILPVRVYLTRAFDRDGPAWLRRNHITTLQVFGESKDWSRIGNAPITAQVRGLSLAGQRIRDRGVTQLAASTGLANLGALDLHETHFGLPGMLALAGATHLPRLSHLNLTRMYVAPEMIRALAEGPLAASLRFLDLGRTWLATVSVAVLAQSPGLANLQTLKLDRIGLSDSAVQSLVLSPHLGHLQGLHLSHNSGISEIGVLALATSSLVRQLRWLRMGSIEATPATWQRLTEAMPPGARLVRD